MEKVSKMETVINFGTMQGSRHLVYQVGTNDCFPPFFLFFVFSLSLSLYPIFFLRYSPFDWFPISPAKLLNIASSFRDSPEKNSFRRLAL